MRYSLIREMDVSNGIGLGVSLFVQGCPFHCKGCFNQETWDFDGGKEWTKEIENQFIKLASKDYIKRVSILGGEPLANENTEGVLQLINTIKAKCPNKSIWLYTGYTWESIMNNEIINTNIFKKQALSSVDIVVDGQFEIDNQDIDNKVIVWAGSTNQRVINVGASLKENKVVLLGE